MRDLNYLNWTMKGVRKGEAEVHSWPSELALRHSCRLTTWEMWSAETGAKAARWLAFFVQAPAHKVVSIIRKRGKCMIINLNFVVMPIF